MKILLFSLFFLMSTYQLVGQDTLFFDNNWKETNKEYAKFYRIDLEKNGGWKRTDYFKENNSVQMTGFYSSLNPEIRQGLFKWFYANGVLKSYVNFLDDEKTGEQYWYYENGNVEAVENYVNGRLHGEFQEFYPNGVLHAEAKFKYGLQHGYSKYYGENGKVIAEGNFEEGDRNGVWKYYDENGNLEHTVEYKTDYIIPEANIFIKLPNSNWSLAEKVEEKVNGYIFKRQSITAPNGMEIIPAIMLYTEDASEFEGNIILYSGFKRRVFSNVGMKINQILTHNNDDYPLDLKNSIIYETNYTLNGSEHYFLMVHIITQENVGIEIYLDMTENIANEYKHEFWNALKSIKEL
jgi:antitoxin component YwqK of YwqJK toxin-antitoxin module